MKKWRVLVGAVCAAASGVMVCSGTASETGSAGFGPPAVCVPIECEGAGVKIGDAAFETVRGYSADDAVEDALAALEKSDDVLAHMETVRRVVVYLKGEDAGSRAFLARLLARAAEAEADGAGTVERGLAWLDAGYFVGASEQMGVDFGWSAGVGQGVAGLGWLERAAEYAGEGGMDVSAVHFAAANIAHPATRDSKRGLYERHMRAAVRGAERGSVLWKNLEAHAAWWDERLEHFAENG